tara:strand:+ start:220 stop:429 length:210 start_codon:yes stop_codon:yes gene_type:complete
MEVVPSEPGRKTDFDTVFAGVGMYCNELGTLVDRDILEKSLLSLHEEQSLVYFSPSDIRPTQYGLLKYE